MTPTEKLRAARDHITDVLGGLEGFEAAMRSEVVHAYDAEGISEPDELGRVRLRFVEQLRGEYGDQLAKVNSQLATHFYVREAAAKKMTADGWRQWHENTTTAHCWVKNNQAFMFTQNVQGQWVADTAMLEQFGHPRTMCWSGTIGELEAFIRGRVAEDLKLEPRDPNAPSKFTPDDPGTAVSHDED